MQLSMLLVNDMTLENNLTSSHGEASVSAMPSANSVKNILSNKLDSHANNLNDLNLNRSRSSCENNLRSLSDELLDQSLFNIIKKEKEVLKEILHHIAEIDRRRLYLTLGYTSLYVYLTDRMGYDGGSAQRRLDAARLSLQVPSVIKSLDQGEITLAQVTCLQKSLRQVKDQRVSLQTKVNILESIKHKTLEETQVQVAQALNLEIKEVPKVKHQANESVRLEVTLSKSQWEKMKTMRELLSNTLPTGEWDQVLEYLATKVIEQKTKKASEVKPTKHLSPKLKQAVLLRDQCCQYKNKLSGKVCGSRWQLEVDHIKPLWAGGAHTPENLQALCANHNQERYRRQAGIRRV